MYFIRFLPPNENAERIFRPQEVERFEHHAITHQACKWKYVNYSLSKISVSRSPLESWKVDKTAQKYCFTAGTFDVEKCKWMNGSTLDFIIKMNHSRAGHSGMLSKTISVKKCKPTSIETITELLKSTSEGHTRKQVQMRAEARNLTTRFSSKVPANFGDSFQCGKVFYSVLDDFPVTVEEFVPGEYRKYVNNNGAC